jgi:hypothetical protein
VGKIGAGDIGNRCTRGVVADLGVHARGSEQDSRGRTWAGMLARRAEPAKSRALRETLK